MATIIDGSDSHYIGGTTEDDFIDGGDGRDRIYAGNGDDFIDGGNDNDVLTGQNGDDTIMGGSGSDVMEGAAGADTFVYTTVDGPNDDIIVGFRASDRFDFENGVDTLQITTQDGVTISDLSLGDAGTRFDNASAAVITFSNGNTLTIATEFVTDAVPDPAQGAATASDSPDSPEVFAAPGAVDDTFEIHDVIAGDAAAIDGMAGNDLIIGGDTDQTLLGGSGNDIIGGGAGMDTIIGGSGSDFMLGGADADTFVLGDGIAGEDDYIGDFSLTDGDSITADAADVASTVDTATGVLITFNGGNTVDIVGTDFDAADISAMYS